MLQYWRINNPFAGSTIINISGEISHFTEYIQFSNGIKKAYTCISLQDHRALLSGHNYENNIFL